MGGSLKGDVFSEVETLETKEKEGKEGKDEGIINITSPAKVIIPIKPNHNTGLTLKYSVSCSMVSL
jgi:hypothetical protein